MFGVYCGNIHQMDRIFRPCEGLEWDEEAEAVIFPRLKPSTATISLRLPESMLAQIKLLANQRNVPYQSLLKVFLADRLKAELKRAS